MIVNPYLFVLCLLIFTHGAPCTCQYCYFCSPVHTAIALLISPQEFHVGSVPPSPYVYPAPCLLPRRSLQRSEIKGYRLGTGWLNPWSKGDSKNKRKNHMRFELMKFLSYDRSKFLVYIQYQNSISRTHHSNFLKQNKNKEVFLYQSGRRRGARGEEIPPHQQMMLFSTEIST